MEASAFRRNVRIALWHEAADDTMITADIVHLPLVAVHDVTGVVTLWSGTGGCHHQ
jgi:hypothetical protein